MPIVIVFWIVKLSYFIIVNLFYVCIIVIYFKFILKIEYIYGLSSRILCVSFCFFGAVLLRTCLFICVAVLMSLYSMMIAIVTCSIIFIEDMFIIVIAVI